MQRPMDLKLVVFEYAGTLVDYGARAAVLAIQEVFAAVGLESPSIEQIGRSCGLPPRERLRRLLESLTAVPSGSASVGTLDMAADLDLDRLHELLDASLGRLVVEHCEPLPGASATWQALRDRGLALAIRSAYPRRHVEAALVRPGLAAIRPDALIGSDDVPTGHSALHQIHRCMERTGVVDPEHVLLVGGTANAMDAARRAATLATGVVEGSGQLGLTLAEWTASPSIRRWGLAEAARARLLGGGARFVIPNLGCLVGLVDYLAQGVDRDRVS